MKKLAVLGGTSAFADPLHVLRAKLPQREAVTNVLDSLRDSCVHSNNGPYVEALETALAERLDVRHAVAVSSGTMALQLLIRSLSLNGNVILPAFTFAGTAQALVWEGLRPMFCDIDRDTFCIDVDQVARLVDNDTSAVIAVNLFGNPCSIDDLTEVCKRNAIPLLFDSAQAFGSLYLGKAVGGFGVAEIFSLHATKVLSTLEGGILTTNDSKLNDRLRLMRNFGFAGYDHVVSLGINGKMSELAAGIGLAALEEVDERIQCNRQIHSLYREYLSKIEMINLFGPPEDCETNAHSYPLLLHRELPLTRDQLCDALWRENIVARRYYFPGCHRMRPFHNDATIRADLPVTDELAVRILILPCFPEMAHRDVAIVCEVLESVMENVDELARHYRLHGVDLRLRQVYE